MDLLHPDAPDTMSLDIRILRLGDIPPEQKREIEALDRAAFTDEPDPGDPQWSAPGWMVLGFHQDRLVSQLGLVEREILVGTEHLRVAGVGGVATYPNWQRHGFASQLLHAAEAWMREELNVPFGLLVCDHETQPVYAKCGWQRVADGLYHQQGEQRLWMEACVMVLRLAEREWLEGEIDLCGLPW